MTSFMSKFKIPTVLGLIIIVAGITIGVYLNLKEQIFLSQAAPNTAPQNIILSNITDTSTVISWQTNSEAASFVTFGQNNPGEQTALDDEDNQTGSKPQPRLIHYVTLKNLLPKTNYQFKIISGKISSDVEKFQTAQPLTNQISFSPIIGAALDGNNPLEKGVAYLSIPETVIQSAPIKTGGNFLIPLSQIRKTDLTEYQLAENTVVKLTIRSDKGEANILFKIKATSSPLPSIKLGQDVDLTTETEKATPEPTPVIQEKDMKKYDLNGDGKINAADNAIILQNFGKKFKDKKADLNGDGKVDQKDLDLMAQELKDLGSQ